MNFQTKKYVLRAAGICRKTDKFEIVNVQCDSKQNGIDTFSLTHKRIVPMDFMEQVR